jgi:signal transduction histidine kinase
MSTALLKFKPQPAPKSTPLDPGILAAAIDVTPDPIAVSENGKVIYANRSFAQLSAKPDASQPYPAADAGDVRWQSANFAAGTRSFSVTTLQRQPAESRPEALHLEMLGRMVGGVAHDFNNLLTAILLHCDLLKTKLPAASPLARRIEEIRHAADQGAGLIRQLMTVGREEKGTPRWVSFNHALQELLPLLRHLAGEHITISLDLTASAPRVGLSLAEAQQLILNLVLNARDAMPEGGEVRLTTREHDLSSGAGVGSASHTFEFTVSDSGSGMASETAAHIFEPFYTTKPFGRGTGLSTVKGIVDGAAGTIGLDTSPGQGTRVMVRLPQIGLPAIEGDRPEPDQQDYIRRRQPSEIQKSQTHQSKKRGAVV